MRVLKTSAIAIFVSFFLPSCESGSDTYFDTVTGSQNGHFRGVKIGAAMNDVKAKENIQPEDEEDDYLYYDFDLSGEDSYTVSYGFDEKGLYEIQVDVYLEKPETASTLYDRFKSHFGKKYGTAEEEDEDFAVWLTDSDVSKEIEISLTNESADYDDGKVSISIYDYDY